MLNSSMTTYAANSTSYFGPGVMVAVEVGAAIYLPWSGILQGLRGRITTAPGAGEQVVITVRINGAPTAITITLAGAVAAYGEDVAHAAAVTAGQYITVEAVTSLNCAASRCEFTLEYIHI